MGNGKVKVLICTTHGHELRGREMLVGRGERRAQGNKGEEKMGQP